VRQAHASRPNSPVTLPIAFLLGTPHESIG
jgi:hypothetical protein